jgi:hypothetical protein
MLERLRLGQEVDSWKAPDWMGFPRAEWRGREDGKIPDRDTMWRCGRADRNPTDHSGIRSHPVPMSPVTNL